MADGRWANLGAAADGAPTCGVAACDHHGGVMACVRRPGHVGTLLATEMHVANVDGAPVMFDDACDVHTPDPA